MIYCGLEFSATESADDSSWKWKISILDKEMIKSCGEAASRAAAIQQAHEAITAGLRADASRERQAPLLHQIHDVILILHGARSLPAAEAVAALRPFLNATRGQVLKGDRIADASVAAVAALIHSLDTRGIATDDLWEVATESSLSFANETSCANPIRPASSD